MQEDKDEDRMEAAKRLAKLDPQVAAEAFREIAYDDDLDDDLRTEAATQLAKLDRWAAEIAFRNISGD